MKIIWFHGKQGPNKHIMDTQRKSSQSKESTGITGIGPQKELNGQTPDDLLEAKVSG